MKAKNLLTLVITGVAALSLAACGNQNRIDLEKFDFQTPAKDKTTAAPQVQVVVGHTYIPNIQFAPSYIAKEQKYYPANLDVQLRHHGADEGLFTALLAGDEHLVIASGDEMLQARSNGLDLVSVGSYYAKYPVKIIVPANSKINTVADLKDKTVGLPGEYGSNWFALQAALENAGLKKTDLKIQSIGYTQLAALKTQQVDAVVGFTNNDTVQFKLAGENVKEIPLTDGEVPLVSGNIVTTSAFANTHPEELKQMLVALKRGMQTSVDEPETALAATKIYDQNLTTPAAEKAALETLHATNQLFAPTGKVSLKQDVQQWEAMNAFLDKLGVLGSKVRVNNAVTNQYITE